MQKDQDQMEVALVPVRQENRQNKADGMDQKIGF